MIEFLLNPWTITVGGGLLVVIFTYVFGFNHKAPNVNLSNQNNQEVTVNNFLNSEKEKSDSYETEFKTNEISKLKQDIRILFIDDLDLNTKLKNLSDAGWSRVSQIKDAPNIDAQEIRDADIIFVDYKGIGDMTSKDQGLSILSALKGRYGDKKYLILYSAHNVPVDAFNRGAHNSLSKNSTIYELEQKILQGVEAIKR